MKRKIRLRIEDLQVTSLAAEGDKKRRARSGQHRVSIRRAESATACHTTAESA